MIPLANQPPFSVFCDRYAFSIGGTDFQWIDVALSAMVSDEWAVFERRLAEGLACTTRAETEGLALPETAIDDAAMAFRYERDLIAGSDMTAWLERAGLSPDEWMAYVTRAVLRKMWAGDIEAVLDRYSPSARQLQAVALAEGVCSSLFDAFEAAFSERAAVAFGARSEALTIGRVDSSVHTDHAAQLERQHVHWLAARPDGDSLARLTRILSIEDAYRTACERSVGDDSLLTVIDAHRLEWILIDVEAIAFAGEAAAREAMLCIRQDGLSLDDVAALSQLSVVRMQMFLADAPPEHRDRLLSEEPGGLMGPLSVDGRFHVATVRGRTLPTLDDDRVARRARAELLRQAGRRAAQDRVTRRPPP